MRDIRQRHGPFGGLLPSVTRRKLLHSYPQNLLARERAAAHPLERLIKRCVCENRSPDTPPRQPGERQRRAWREFDLGAALDQLGGDVVLDGQNAIAKSIIQAERDCAAQVLARPARELALDAKDTDVRPRPVGGRCKIVKIAQDEKPLRTRLWRSL